MALRSLRSRTVRTDLQKCRWRVFLVWARALVWGWGLEGGSGLQGCRCSLYPRCRRYPLDRCCTDPPPLPLIHQSCCVRFCHGFSFEGAGGLLGTQWYEVLLIDVKIIYNQKQRAICKVTQSKNNSSNLGYLAIRELKVFIFLSHIRIIYSFINITISS